jgi:lipopolysaccharide transport system ATP-binding protein
MSSERGAVELDGIGKRFRRGPDSASTIKDAVVGRRRRQRRTASPFWALRDVTYRVAPGTTLGLIGRNGAGKSTLLRLVGGVGRPDEGRCTVTGRVGALLELGKEFHPELTGRENVVMAAVIAGLPRRQALALLPTVVEFAELEAFVDSPLRTYSTGMQARLAFSTAIHVEPDVLLVDEVLAVGDLGFQQRCMDRMRAFRDSGVTIVMVSHDPHLVRDLCDEVVWLRKGRIAAAGPTDDVVRTYTRTMSAEAEAATPAGPDRTTESGDLLRLGENRFGSQAARLTWVRVLDQVGDGIRAVPAGGEVQVDVAVEVPADVGPCRLAVKLRRQHDDLLCLDSSTDVHPPGGRARMTIRRLDLAPGDYAFDVGLFTADWEDTLDVHLGAYPLELTGSPRTDALVTPPVAWSRA